MQYCQNFDLMDRGPMPFVTELNVVASTNPNYRSTIWTGDYLQLTVMSIPLNDDIGLEVHPDTNQFLYVVEGTGCVQMGPSNDNLIYCRPVWTGNCIFVPAGTWHNVVNTGNVDLKLFTIYAPPHHPHGTLHKTKADAVKQGD